MMLGMDSEDIYVQRARKELREFLIECHKGEPYRREEFVDCVSGISEKLISPDDIDLTMRHLANGDEDDLIALAWVLPLAMHCVWLERRFFRMLNLLDHLNGIDALAWKAGEDS